MVSVSHRTSIFFTRETSMYSKCGSLVHLDTNMGQITLDDTSIYISRAMEQNLKEMGMNDLTGVGLAGRRKLEAMEIRHGRKLTKTYSFSGLFNSLANYEWKCES